MSSMRKTEWKDDAVSPVVGVMLMLVVTIIIAAVIAAFAGGVATDTDAASNVVVKLDSYDMKTIGYGGSWSSGYEFLYFYNSSTTNEQLKNTKSFNYAPYTMVFMHKGGEALDVRDLKLAITYNGATFSTPVTDMLTDKEKWNVGEKLVLNLGSEDIKDLTGGLLFGLSQANMIHFNDGATYPTTFDWSLTDGTGYVIAKGTADTNYDSSKVHTHFANGPDTCSCGFVCDHSGYHTGTENGQLVCYTCGYVGLSHEDSDNDGKCDDCGAPYSS